MAQWISASDFGSGGRRFDPGRIRYHLQPDLLGVAAYCHDTAGSLSVLSY